MKRMFTRGIGMGLVILACSTSYAQFTLSGQYRPRLEVRNGFKTPILEDQNPAAFIEHRARLTAGYKKEKVGFKMSVQDIRVWGETGQINKSDQLLSAHEAYGDYYASPKSTFRIGRQEVAYDGHRLFGTLGWAAQARSFDAARYMYKDTMGNQFDAMVSWNQNGYGDGAPEPANLTGNVYSIGAGGGTNRIFNLGLPKSQQMLYYKRTMSSGSVGVMLLSDVFDINDSTGYSQFTFGITPDFKFGDVKVGGQFFYTGGQAGKTLNGAGDGYDNIDLGGFMFNAYVQLPKVTGKPMLGVDYLSGDDETTTDKVEGWSPSYGTNHKFYGWMDYFYVGNGHGGGNAGSAGLLDIYLKTAFKTGDKSKLVGHAHYFASTATRTNGTDEYDGGLGTEIDLVYVNKLTAGVTLKIGYSQMFGITDTMKQLKFSNPDQEIADYQGWSWVMIDFTPKFIN